MKSCTFPFHILQINENIVEFGGRGDIPTMYLKVQERLPAVHHVAERKDKEAGEEPLLQLRCEWKRSSEAAYQTNWRMKLNRIDCIFPHSFTY